jgi:pSer/pThr/pTyr-binding forkhead associated (FHA) protein
MGVRLHVRSCWASRSEADAVYELEQTRILIGRGRGADVRLPHRAVSVRHATLELTGARYAIVDHGTTNGTLVQGARVVPGRPKPLRDGDRIEIGGFSIRFTSGVPVGRPTSSERTASLARRLAREALLEPDEDLRPFLTVLNGPSEGEVVPLGEPPARLSIGRGDGCDVTLNDADASREHAEIEVALDGVWIRDLASKNGVIVNGRSVDERLLDDRDEIRIGATVLRFEDPAAAHVDALEEGEDAEVEAPTWEDVQPGAPEAPEAPGAEAEGAADAGEGDARRDAEATVDETEPAPAASAAAPRRSIAPADLVIYVLASVVFAVSVLGLLWLLRS